MSMMVGSVSTGSKRVIQIKNRDGSVAGTISFSKPQQQKKKKLQYSFKTISSQILLSKTSNTAGKAVTKARGTIAMLLRKLGTGEYDDEEVEMAINHAKKMERVAKKRMKHLKQEEEIKQKGRSEELQDGLEEKVEKQVEEDTGQVEGAANEEVVGEEEIQELLEDYQKMMQKSMEELLQQSMEDVFKEAGLEELSEDLMEVTNDIDASDFEELKKKHRADELREIADADMKYLRAFFNKLEKEKQELSSGQSNYSGVTLGVAGLDMPVEMPDLPALVEGGSVDLTL